MDSAGDVFVTDTDNSLVKEVLPDGTIKPIGSGWATRSAWRWTLLATSS